MHLHIQKMASRKIFDYTARSKVTKILLVKDHAHNRKELFCVKNIESTYGTLAVGQFNWRRRRGHFVWKSGHVVSAPSLHRVYWLPHIESTDSMSFWARWYHTSIWIKGSDWVFYSLQLNIPEETVHRRNTLEIIRSSTKERGKFVRDNRHSCVRIESRYKLIIDPSEDESLVRLLFSYNILPEGKTRVYICSDFPSDQHSEVCFPIIPCVFTVIF